MNSNHDLLHVEVSDDSTLKVILQDNLFNDNVEDRDFEDLTAAVSRINSMSLKLDLPYNIKQLEEVIKRLCQNKYFKPLEQLLKDIDRVVKKNKNQKYIAEPEKVLFCKEISEEDSTSLNLFTRNSIFKILPKNEFSSNKNSENIQVFKGWEKDQIIKIKGPILNQYDENLFLALIKIWHDRKAFGNKIKTSIFEIWKYLGNKSNPNLRSKQNIMDSLDRMGDVRITTYKNNLAYSKFSVLKFKRDEVSSKNTKSLIISFDEDVLHSYLLGEYTTFNYNLTTLLNSYARKLYMLLISNSYPSDSHYKKMHIDKLRSVFGVKESTPKKTFKRFLEKALNDLITHGVFQEGSSFLCEDFLHFDIPRELYLRESKYSSRANNYQQKVLQ